MIIGAMKSGTSSLYQYLASHPDILQSRVKEPEYFSENQVHGISVKNYEKVWGKKSKYKIEASTGYTKYPFERGVPRRIKECGIMPKFIYVIRDPIDRIESHYNWIKRENIFDIESFYDSRVIEVSKYYQQMKKFLEVFKERERYHVVEFDRMVKETKKEVEKCFDFIGVGANQISGKMRAYNKKPKRKFDIWIDNISKTKNAIGRLMKSSKRKRLKKILRYLTPKYEPKKMTDYERSTVCEMLRDDMRQLESEFGFDVSKWGF